LRNPRTSLALVALVAAAVALLAGPGTQGASAGSAGRGRSPKMLYPTLDYGHPSIPLLWHHWVRPRRWDDGDDVSVTSAHWVAWNQKEARARVRVVIAGQRGRASVRLSDPGYCAAAGGYGFLTETVHGGPWGRGAATDLTGQCESDSPSGRVQDLARRAARASRPTLRLRPSGLGPLRIGMSPEQAERALGASVDVEEGISDCSFWSIQGVGSSTQLIAFSGRLGYITMFRPGPETIRGISVGDSVAKLRRRLGGRLHPGRSAAEDFAGPRLFVSERRDGAAYLLEFDTYKGKVSTIEAARRHVIETFQECA
jgi:hypothetical protein